MDIQDLGALGEFIAAIAVLITLIYCSIQIRETRNQWAEQITQKRFDRYITMINERNASP